MRTKNKNRKQDQQRDRARGSEHDKRAAARRRFGLILPFHKLAQCIAQALHVVVEIRVGTHLNGIAKSKALKRRRKIHLLWDRSALNQDRDYRDVPVERGCDFQAHEIIGIVEAACAGFVARLQPLVPDDCEQHMALVDALLDCISKIRSELDRVDVLEQMLLAKGCF